MKTAGRFLILLVDDFPDSLRWSAQLLAHEHDVAIATSGAAALELARSQQPDLILLAAQLPDMDGYQVCKAMQCSPATATIPLVFLSHENAPEKEALALECGAVDFLAKPLHPEILRARVRTRLAVKRENDQLRDLAMVDCLTGIANRRAFDAALHKEWIRCLHGALPLSLLMIDVDHFKRFNDSYGHQAGDACLSLLALAMQRATRRPEDMVCRYGGEEFAILLPGQTTRGGRVIAERLMDEVAQLQIANPLATTASQITVSIGIASILPDEHASSKQLIHLADQLLYQSKIAGRNRYSIGDSDAIATPPQFIAETPLALPA